MKNKTSTIINRIKSHPLFDTLFGLEGNPKVCVYMEPLWGIPHSLIAPFATIYMYALGVTDIQIGLLISISMIIQVLFCFSGGIITDKFGRKFTTMFGDIMGWVLACIVWAVSQNFWFFLIAVSLNCFEQVNQTAWHCLLTEDADKTKIVSIYTWVNIAGLLAVFFAPLSGLFIKTFSLVPVMRVLYGTFAFTMLIKTILTGLFCKETETGKIRKEKTKDVSFLTMVKEYKHLLPEIWKNKAAIQTLIILAVVLITNSISINFFSLYANQNLNVSEQMLAVFPIIKAIIMITFFFGLQKLLDKFGLKVPMAFGFGLYIACHLILIISPPSNIWTVFLYVFIEAIAVALVNPRKESMLILNIGKGERARTIALITSLTIALSVPFGYISGLLSSMDRRLPFVLSIGFFILALIVLAFFKETPIKTENLDIVEVVEEHHIIEEL